MLTKLSIGAAVVLLLLAALWPAAFSLPAIASVAVCTAAVVSALKAGEMGRYIWLWTLVAIAVVFNPIAPVGMPYAAHVILSAACAMTLLGWLMVLQRNELPQSVAQVLHPSQPR
jgi:hypothetical protein